MSLIPSNPAVEAKLLELREERAKARELFRLAVLRECVTWEAETLLELEEFREKGGFATVQDSLRQAIQQKRIQEKQKHNRRHHPMMGSPQQPPPTIYYVGGESRDNFLADKIDIRKAISCIHETTAIPVIDEPTMATERAALRFDIIKKVKQEIRAALEAEQDEQDEQDAKDMAIVEEHRLAQEALLSASMRMRGR
jgi:hypothetical protein